MIPKISKYHYVKFLGKGGFGETYLYQANDNEQVAIKFIERKKKSNLKLIKEEIQILKSLATPCHPNVLCFKDSGKVGNYIYIITEYIKGFNLTDFMKPLRMNNTSIDPIMFLQIALGAITGLHHIHSKNMAHSDIKPDNIMFDDLTFQLKYIDVGLVCFSETCKIQGTIEFFPPVYLSKMLGRTGVKITTEIAQSADIYALGLMFYKILMNRSVYPFNFRDSNGYNKADILQYIEFVESKPIKPKYKQSTKSINTKINNLVGTMLLPHYSKRPTASELIRPFTDILKEIDFVTQISKREEEHKSRYFSSKKDISEILGENIDYNHQEETSVITSTVPSPVHSSEMHDLLQRM